MDISKSTAWRPGAAVCRCCLTEGCYKDISTEYFWMGQKEVYSEMLLHTFDVTISYAQSGGPNSQSRLICDGCISRLREASEFKKQVQQCEKTFMEHLDGGASSNIVLIGADPDPVKIGEEAVKLEDVKVERIHSDDDADGFADQGGFDDNDGFDSDLDDEPLTKLATKKPKKEKEVEIDIPEPPKTTKRKSVIKLKGTASKKAKTKKAETGESSKTKVAKEKKKDVKQQSARGNATIVLKHSTVYPFKLPAHDIVCVYCDVPFTSSIQFRKHMETAHWDLRKHQYSTGSYMKVDCSDINCRICDKKFDDLNKIANHLFDDHALKLDLTKGIAIHPYKFEQNKIECMICGGEFPSLRNLSKHMGSHFQNYVCSECGKAFAVREVLLSHVKFTHNEGKFMCRKCRQLFNTAEERQQHLRTNQKCFPYQCRHCFDRFQTADSKKKHMMEFHKETQQQITCIKCGEVFMERKKYNAHFNLHHSDMFVCKYCSKKFGSNDSLKRHYKEYHERNVEYQCDVCAKLFTRKNALKVHKWIHSTKSRFVCENCDRRFNFKVTYVRHMRMKHPEVKL